MIRCPGVGPSEEGAGGGGGGLPKTGGYLGVFYKILSVWSA